MKTYKMLKLPYKRTPAGEMRLRVTFSNGDLKPYATQVAQTRMLDYEDDWCNAEKEIVKC